MGNSASVKDLKVIVVGAGYGGTSAAKNLDAECDVTLIEPGDAMNHKVAALRGVVVPGWEKRTRIPLDKLLKRGKVVQAEVASIETGKVILKNGTVLDCDYIILAHGQGLTTFPCGELICM